MFNYIEKLFPGLIEHIRRLPTALKVVIILLLVSSPFAVARAPMAWRAIKPLLDRQYLVSGFTLVIGSLVLLVSVLAPYVLATLIRPRTRLLTFCREWIRFRRHFDMLYLRIEVYLLRKEDAAIDSPEWRQIEMLLPEYWRFRSRLRHLFFLVGEEKLIAQRVPGWEQLKRTEAMVRENDYKTPFSFILDLGNPIAAVNLRGKALWAALHISDEYLEYLSYKHPHVRKSMGEAQQDQGQMLQGSTSAHVGKSA